VRVLGLDPWHDGRALRGLIGVALQSAGIDADLTVRETLRLYAGLYRRPRPVAELLELLDLQATARQRVSALSGGQQRRLDLALALVGDPRLLVLDEPTTGLDPGSRRALWDIVRRLRDEGCTVLLSSHYMDEVQALADRILVLGHGHVVTEATPATLAGRDLAAATISFLTPEPGWEAALADQALDLEVRSDTVVIRSSAPTAVLDRLTSWATAQSQELLGLTVTRPSLEDAYLELAERRSPP
jgi:ABC-2 type transport system ATP-binding protein